MTLDRKAFSRPSPTDRRTDGQPMTEVGEVIVLAGRGPEVENRKPGKREITLLSAESWARACHDLGVDLPG
jgi:hypothetical protein